MVKCGQMKWTGEMINVTRTGNTRTESTETHPSVLGNKTGDAKNTTSRSSEEF